MGIPNIFNLKTKKKKPLITKLRSTNPPMPTILEGKPFIEYDVNQNNLDVLRTRATQGDTQGDSQSQFQLGEIYEKKSLEEPQYNTAAQYNKVAMKWYRKAADRDHIDAQFQLGKIYENKSAEEPQYNKEAEMWYRKEAMKWYKKAADQGHRDAQYKVSEIEKCKTKPVCVVSGGKKTAKQRNKRRRKTSTRRRR